MTTGRTVCFVCFVLFLGTTHCNNATSAESNATKNTQQQPTTAQNTEITESPKPTSKKVSICTSSIPKPTQKQENHLQEQCIFFLPNNNTLILVLVVLTVACFTLLLTTLLCACHVCHMKVLVSRFQPHHSNVDLYAMNKRNESPFRDEEQAVREPTETCPMLSEVTTQEEKNKEESAEANTEPPVEGLNGDVAQEEGNGCEAVNQEPDVGPPEDSAIEV